jgi:hypothetical protein
LSQEFQTTLAAKEAEIAAAKSGQKAPDELIKPTRPNADDYEDDSAKYDRDMEKYHDDMDDYREKKFDQKIDQRVKQTQTATVQQQQHQQTVAAYAKEEAKVAAKIEDYDEVVGDVATDLKALGKKGEAIMAIIQRTKNPNIIYAMGKDPDKFERVATASDPLEVAMIAAEIGAGLAKPAKKRHETTTSPGGGGGSASSDKIKKGDSAETIIAKRRKQLAAKKDGG